MKVSLTYQYFVLFKYVVYYSYYLDSMDIVTANGKNMVYRYLDGGVLLVKEFIADPSPARLYHISSDRLGSVEKVTGGDGEPVFEASYDEWGRQTVSTNKIGFIRGYTGHEMLPEFGLINMNGRMYDPLLARFLSPDDYVQMPMSPQGFNRYSYCLNNPIRYTDPSGELFTWNFGKHGFSFGLNFSPLGIPLGFGINIGWADGVSVGGYGEIGYRVGGSGFGSGISFSQSLNYNVSNGQWSTITTESIYASYGVLNAGGDFSQSYNMGTGKWGMGWNAGVGIGLGNDELGLGLNVSYGTDGWSYGVGGYHNPNAWDANPDYEPHIWNIEQKIQFTNNCYSYVLDDIFNGNFHGLQPGGSSPIGENINLEYVMNAAIRDGRVKKPSFWNKLGFGKNGYYSVYLVIEKGVDYHWYRQDKGGLWSHKRGDFPVCNVDASNKLISNPVRANRNYGQHKYYDGGIYLWIRKR